MRSHVAINPVMSTQKNSPIHPVNVTDIAVVDTDRRSAVTKANLGEPVLSIHRNFEDVASVWKCIEETGQPFVFQSYAWVKEWYRIVADSDSVKAYFVVVEYPRGTPLMLLPLGIRQGTFVKYLVWLGGVLSDYHAPLLDANYSNVINERLFDAIWQEVKKLLPPFDAIFLEKQPECIANQKNPFTQLCTQPHPSNAHYTQLSGSLDSFINARRSKKSVNTEKRKERRLAEFGELNFVMARNTEEVKKLLPALIRQKGLGYQDLGVPNIFEVAENRQFVEQITGRYHDSFVLLCGLTVGERIAATFWGLVYQQRLYYLLPAYEHDELARFSPGNVLLRHIFDWCFKNNVKTFDFTVGDERYKDFWCDHVMKLYDHFEGVSIRGHFAIEVIKAQRKIKRKVKHSPLLAKTFIRIRKHAAKLWHQ